MFYILNTYNKYIKELKDGIVCIRYSFLIILYIELYTIPLEKVERGEIQFWSKILLFIFTEFEFGAYFDRRELEFNYINGEMTRKC